VIFLNALLLLLAVPAFAGFVVEPEAIHLGKIDKGDKITCSVMVYNTGAEILRIARIISDCDCTTIKTASYVVNPYSSEEMVITFDSEGEDTGGFTKKVHILTKSGDKVIRISGEVVSPITKLKSREKPRIEAETGNFQALHKERSVLSIRSEQEYPLYVAYFYSAGCKDCLRISKLLDKMQEKIGNLQLRKFNLDVEDNMLLLEAVAMMYQIPKDESVAPPVVFLAHAGNRYYLKGKSITEEAIRSFGEIPISADAKYIKEQEPPGQAPWILAKKHLPDAKERIVSRFRSFKILPIILAGLVDGINPCAFAAIIFLITHLSMIIRKSKRYILFSGIFFSMGIFLAYFCLGLGLSKFIYSLSGVTIFAKLLYPFIGALTLVLAIFSFIDYLNTRKNPSNPGVKPLSQSIILKIPDVLRQKIYKILQVTAKRRVFIGLAFLAGIVISLLELVCTGQIYLPTIVFMNQATNYQPHVVGFLLLYSVCFIIPLLLVFFLFFWGIRSQKIGEFAKKHIATAKLLITGVFMFFSIYMFSVAFKTF